MIKKSDSVEMIVSGLTLDTGTMNTNVVLKDPANRLNLPIWIGLLEATAMATGLGGIETARPMTHDVLMDILRKVEGSVEFVEITDLKENTALICLNIAGRQFAIDARPSDAIAIALRDKTPIYVTKDVLEASALPQQAEEEQKEPEPTSKEKWSEILAKISPGDFKYKM